MKHFAPLAFSFQLDFIKMAVVHLPYSATPPSDR